MVGEESLSTTLPFLYLLNISRHRDGTKRDLHLIALCPMGMGIFYLSSADWIFFRKGNFIMFTKLWRKSPSETNSLFAFSRLIPIFLNFLDVTLSRFNSTYYLDQNWAPPLSIYMVVSLFAYILHLMADLKSTTVI